MIEDDVALILEAYKIVKENTVESAGIAQPLAQSQGTETVFSGSNNYAPGDNRNPLPKKKKKRKAKINIYKRVLTEGSIKDDYMGRPTHGKPDETREAYEARVQEERERRMKEITANSKLSEEDEEVVNDVMDGMEDLHGRDSLFIQLKPQLEKYILAEKNGEIRDTKNTFRFYKAVLWFVIKEASIKSVTKASLLELLTNSTTIYQLYDALLNMKVGSGGHDYQTQRR